MVVKIKSYVVTNRLMHQLQVALPGVRDKNTGIAEVDSVGVYMDEDNQIIISFLNLKSLW